MHRLWMVSGSNWHSSDSYSPRCRVCTFLKTLQTPSTEPGDIWNHHRPSLKLPLRVQWAEAARLKLQTKRQRHTGKQEREHGPTALPCGQNARTNSLVVEPRCTKSAGELLVPQIVPLSVPLLMPTLKELFFFGLQPELLSFELFCLMSVFCLNSPISVL